MIGGGGITRKLAYDTAIISINMVGISHVRMVLNSEQFWTFVNKRNVPISFQEQFKTWEKGK